MNWKTYLHQSRLLEQDHSQEDIDLLQAKYRRAYQKAYRESRKETKKELTVSLDHALYQRIEEEALKSSLSVPAFLRESSIAYLDNTVIPVYPEMLQQILLQVKRIGANVSLLCKKGYTTNLLRPDEIESLQSELMRLQEKLEQVRL